MKHFWLFTLLLCSSPILLAAQNVHEQGTVVRMRMTDCAGPQHRIMAALSGSASMPSGELCPEYVLVGDKVVYVILGREADQLIPLAESTRFHFQKNEILIRIDDARKELRFQIKAMVLRPEWDRHQLREQEEMSEAERHPVEPVAVGNRR